MLLRFVLVVGFLVCVGAAADTLSGRVVRVVDGDTLVLLVAEHEQERIRLAGIDCPERKQAFGTRAKQALTRRVAGKEVTVEWEKHDRYGRIVGKVVYGGHDVDLALAREGMCWWYRKYAHEQSPADRVLYENAEAKAREKSWGCSGIPIPCRRGCGGGSTIMVDEIDYWFDVAWAVFTEGQWDAESFPPLNDMEAQRAWLGVSVLHGPQAPPRRGRSMRLSRGP